MGIGASAGGLEALTELFAKLPADTGMAFVVISHIPADEPSLLDELLGRAASMPVRPASDGVAVAPDHVYVIQPGTMVGYAHGRLVVTPRAHDGPAMPIDHFFRALAAGRKSRSVGVVVSGTGSDGALGVQEIKFAGGITFAQDVRSAKFDSMPLAALATGCVDFMLPPAQIAAELSALAVRLRTTAPKIPIRDPELDLDSSDSGEDLAKVLGVLRAVREVDFSLYRQTTVKRRILRRMILNKVDSLPDYLALLKDRPVEVEALYNDVLINVTHFFRDPSLFEALKRQIFPALLKGRGPDDPIRIWVPGCSTGEEAYSIAITVLETLSELRKNTPFQIFATDVSENALEKARTGAYIENISCDVSPERLRRFFTRTGKLWQINKTIRDRCVFARQNLTRDPPFSRLDLISCRNVLIYFEPVLQRRVLPVFHYALKPASYLVLGSSETLAGHTELFSAADKRQKIYVKNASSSRLGLEVLAGRRVGARDDELDRPAGKTDGKGYGGMDAQHEADRLVMSRYAPPGVIVNADLQIVQFRGHTGPYLEPAPGEASLSLLKMAREDLAYELRALVHKARRSEGAVRADGVRLRGEGRERQVSIEVVPLRGGLGGEAVEGRWFLVIFEEQEAAKAPRETGKKGPRDARVQKLERELAATKEYLQATIEEQEATNEELQSSNEELLSSNEELQSINEELETAKEELTSTNEELSTLNDELAARNGELERLNDDLGNLLTSVDVAIVMLSRDLRIRRFTPQAERVLNLIKSDIGRPFADLNPRIDAPDLGSLLAEVVTTGTDRERHVRDREGRLYWMRLKPYRTSDGKDDGAVILLVDIDRLRLGLSPEGAQDS